MSIKISRGSEIVSNEDIKPDFIHNRFDLWHDAADYDIVCAECGSGKYTFEVRYEDGEAQMGLWMMDIPVEVVEAAAKEIFTWHDDIKKIYYTHYLHSVGQAKIGKHFSIDLPDTLEKFDQKSSGKTRSSLRRKIRLLEKETQAEVTYRVYSIQDEIPVEVMRDYLRMKNETFPQYSEEYIEGLTADDVKDFICSSHVTHVYVMKIGEIMAGVVLSGEQCKNINFDNITYNVAYKKYSPGLIVYDYYLKSLVKKGGGTVFLGGGEWDYKKRYSAEETVVYEGRFYRSKLHMMFANFRAALHS